MISNKNDSAKDVREEEETQDQKNLMNKAAGYVIKQYIYEINKYKLMIQKQIQYQQLKKTCMILSNIQH